MYREPAMVEGPKRLGLLKDSRDQPTRNEWLLARGHQVDTPL